MFVVNSIYCIFSIYIINKKALNYKKKYFKQINLNLDAQSFADTKYSNGKIFFLYNIFFFFND